MIPDILKLECHYCNSVTCYPSNTVACRFAWGTKLECYGCGAEANYEKKFCLESILELWRN